MLSCDNICRGVEPFCVGLEEVCVKGFADVEQQLGVEGGFVEDALHRAGGDGDLLGEPLVGVALAAQLIADDVADVYLHSGCCLGDVLPIPCIHSDDHRQKRRRAISSPNCGRGIPLKGKTKTLAHRQAFLFVIL